MCIYIKRKNIVHIKFNIQASPRAIVTYQPQKKGGIYKKVTGSASDETDPRMPNSTVKRHSFLKTAYQE